jgi:hypothetical protein
VRRCRRRYHRRAATTTTAAPTRTHTHTYTYTHARCVCRQTGKNGRVRVTSMFSATMPVAVERMAKKYLRHPAIVQVSTCQPYFTMLSPMKNKKTIVMLSTWSFEDIVNRSQLLIDGGGGTRGQEVPAPPSHCAGKLLAHRQLYQSLQPLAVIRMPFPFICCSELLLAVECMVKQYLRHPAIVQPSYRSTALHDCPHHLQSLNCCLSVTFDFILYLLDRFEVLVALERMAK